jgi:hypothetical protein
MSTTTSTTPSTRRRVPGLALVVGAFLLSTGLNLAVQALDWVVGSGDPHRPEGPVDSIQGIALFGGVAVVLALAVAVPAAADPRRAQIGAIVLGALALLSVVVFWSGAPASLGAAAAWLAGFGRGATPQTGAARGFGVVGLVLAVLTIVVTFAGYAASGLFG